MNKKLSPIIYSELIRGKYINKHKFEKTSLNENELYKELIKHCFDYKNIYETLGYELIEKEDYFYLKKSNIIIDDETYIEKNQIKEHVLLISIFKYLNENKISLDILLNINQGIEDKELLNMLNNEKYANIFEVTEISKNSKPIQDILIKRNILEYNHKNNLILTNVGKDYLKFIENIGKNIFNN